MHIVHVYKDYYPVFGGIENHIKVLGEAQAAQGHTVTVLVTNPNRLLAHEIINGVAVWRVPRLLTVASTPLSIHLPWKLHQLKPDLTHLHFPYPIAEISQYLFARQRPFVITYHSDIVKQKNILRFYRPLLTRILQRASRILPTSENYIASSPFLRPLAQRCTPIPLSVDLARFSQAVPLFPPVDMPTLVFVGRHRHYKGIDTLIRIMPNIQARLLIGGDGPERSSWEALAQTVQVTDKVHFLGNIPDTDLPALYASGNIFILPANSRAEAFGKVLLEAMASGLPCITTELGTGTSYVVHHEQTGLVVPPNDVVALETAVSRLLNNPDLCHQFGQAGRQRAQEFTLEKMVSRVEMVYQQILNNHI